MAARAALWDTKVPRTRSVEYKARNLISTQDAISGFDTRQVQTATDFELPDYWDEGRVLDGRQHWPVCVTLNLVMQHFIHPLANFKLTFCIHEIPPRHFLDAALEEEEAVPFRLLLMFSFDSDDTVNLHGTRLLGNNELTYDQLSDLITVCALSPLVYKVSC